MLQIWSKLHIILLHRISYLFNYWIVTNFFKLIQVKTWIEHLLFKLFSPCTQSKNQYLKFSKSVNPPQKQYTKQIQNFQYYKRTAITTLRLLAVVEQEQILLFLNKHPAMI